MRYSEKGVIKHSTRTCQTPSTEALQHLFHLDHQGTFYCDSNYCISRGSNTFFEPYLFFLIREGTLHLDYQGQHYEATANCCLFFNSDLPHTYYTNTTVTFHFIRFGGNQSDYYYQKICPNDSILFKAENTEALASCFARIAEQTEQVLPNEHLISAYIHELLSFTLSSKEKYATDNSRRVAESIRYMKQHLEEPVSLKEIAEHVHISPHYLHKLFKTYTNTSPGEYFINLRLSHAKMLLITSPHSVAEIAFMCGFQTSAHFIHMFQKHVGTTPLQYRKNCQ